MGSIDGASALIVAHPGHEIRIHGWLELTSPLVFILTDGSGRSGKSRLGAAKKYLATIGVRPGSIFGRFTDKTIYHALLERRFELFIRLVDELWDVMVRFPLAYVVGDATEGYNPTHDVCRLIINNAVAAANRSNGHQISNYDYPVVNRPDWCPGDLHDRAIWLNLDEPTFSRKIVAAQTYYPELFLEVEESLKDHRKGPLKRYLDRYGESGSTPTAGLEMFRTECLRPATPEREPINQFEHVRPFYELHGEEQVEAGYYSRTIRYREHILPLAEAMSKHVESSI